MPHTPPHVSPSPAESIYRNLGWYLEQKRVGFPRFFFLGDEDLTDLLSSSKVPDHPQPYP